MNCTAIRDLLPLHLTGALSADEQVAVDNHLHHCPECRATLGELRQVLGALPSAPRVQIDLASLFAEVARREHQHERRWRRVALAALAACVLVALGALVLRLEIKADRDQVVVRWGAPVLPTPLPSPPQIATKTPDSPPIDPEQLRMLSDLIQALAQDVVDRDEARLAQIQRLQHELQQVQDQATHRWTLTQRDLTALYLAQFPTRKEKE